MELVSSETKDRGVEGVKLRNLGVSCHTREQRRYTLWYATCREG